MKNTDTFTRYSKLPTEQLNPRTRDLDRVPLRRVLEILNHEDMLIPLALAKAIPQIEKAARAVSKTYLAGGRIFFIGAGTSGRLGVLEAAEIPPTYGVGPEVFTALMAGGQGAVFHSKEGAEDVFENGEKEISRLAGRGDTVIGIAASGVTPYVGGGLAAGRKKGAMTVLVTCNPREKYGAAAIRVALDVGPEPVAGSTRMKSGTATKLALNMISTASMIISGKVYHNWMVDVKTTSKKLVLRAERITATVGGVPREEARRLLDMTGNDVKTAIVMARLGITKALAEARIKKARGFLKNILG
ncbi:MAG TPA: N-acetylmuramic acid 6-phosphate etherase [Elusimicrobiales bacterium]|nr:N-acetylmuramic acid 6-phosphate etherase [Elusimicrobiales bacterium]